MALPKMSEIEKVNIDPQNKINPLYMNFNSLVWYSSLAIGDEKNNYVADFLNRSCELLNEEINEEIKEKNFLLISKLIFYIFQRVKKVLIS